MLTWHGVDVMLALTRRVRLTSSLKYSCSLANFRTHNDGGAASSAGALNSSTASNIVGIFSLFSNHINIRGAGSAVACLLALGSAGLVASICIAAMDYPNTAVFVGNGVGKGTAIKLMRCADDGPNFLLFLFRVR